MHLPLLPSARAAAVMTTWGCLALLSGCGRGDAHNHGAHAKAEHAEHVHAAKHGGVAVELGEHEFQVEFTFGDTPGTLLAYLLDGHMNEYVRIEAARFTATAKVDGETFPVMFEATADSATGEKVGDSSLFTAKIAGVPAGHTVDLVVPTLVIKGRTYTNVIARVPVRTKP